MTNDEVFSINDIKMIIYRCLMKMHSFYRWTLAPLVFEASQAEFFKRVKCKLIYEYGKNRKKNLTIFLSVNLFIVYNTQRILRFQTDILLTVLLYF